MKFTQAPKVLTLQKPWGWGILHAGKGIENRTWPTKYRGDLLIHQGKTHDPGAMQFPPMKAALDRQGDDVRIFEPGVHGGVTLTGCHLAEPECCASGWGIKKHGMWHWEVEDPWALETPVPARGSLGLWWPDLTVIEAVREHWKDQTHA